MEARSLKCHNESARYSAAEQHGREVQETFACWNRKPLLRRIYHDFYGQIREFLRTDTPAATVEIGTGFGSLKTICPNCIATDIFPSAWTDQVEDIYSLSFPVGSIANLVLCDVFHHLEFPGDALAECARVLVGGGRVIILEPDMGLLGLLVYGLFHHEPLGIHNNISWCRSRDDSLRPNRYYAAQANAHRIFYKKEFAEFLLGWRVVKLQRFAAISYVASGGFRRPQLYPIALYPLMKLLDQGLSWLPFLFATRMLIVLEKTK